MRAGSGFAGAAVLAGETKGAAEGFEESMAVFAGARLPVFFGGRKREPQEIGGGRKEASTHAQTKHGAFK